MNPRVKHTVTKKNLFYAFMSLGLAYSGVEYLCRAVTWARKMEFPDE